DVSGFECAGAAGAGAVDRPPGPGAAAATLRRSGTVRRTQHRAHAVSGGTPGDTRGAVSGVCVRFVMPTDRAPWAWLVAGCSMRPSHHGYLGASRHPWPCLLFVLPLLLAYEVGVVWLGGTQPDALRNGADTWLRWGLETFGLTQLYCAPALVALLFLG